MLTWVKTIGYVAYTSSRSDDVTEDYRMSVMPTSLRTKHVLRASQDAYRPPLNTCINIYSHHINNVYNIKTNKTHHTKKEKPKIYKKMSINLYMYKNV